MLKDIFLQYDKLQDQYGDKKLNAIYGGGCTNEPDLCLVFVNPTARNKTCNKSWGGIRYPWLTTKQIWSITNMPTMSGAQSTATQIIRLIGPMSAKIRDRISSK